MAIKYRHILALILFAFIITVAHCDENGPANDGSNDDGSDDDGSDDDGSNDDGSDDDGSYGSSGGGLGSSYGSLDINRSSFPSDFIFGAATSAFQIEGASDRRGLNIWDVFIENNRDQIANQSDARVAADSYHRYKEDVSLLSGLGFDAYRFSISWSRLLPTGRISGGINRDGVRYYNALIDEILSKGMTPFATIFHFDLPQALEDEYNGFLSEKIVEDFTRYSELCFGFFGNKVKHWITLNEPWSYSTMGYAYGCFPPNRCSERETQGRQTLINPGFRVGRFASSNPKIRCKYGNSGTEPYMVTHNMLLAHAAAVKIYRERYQKSQGGQIGVTLVTQWFEPHNPKMKTDVDAATRALAFVFGWYMDPLFTGAYPTEMVTYIDGDRLPRFKDDEAAMVKGSYDFIGVNYYTAEYSQDIPCGKGEKNYITDPCVSLTKFRNGKPIGRKTGAEWLYVYPPGFQRLLVHIKDKYNNPPIYVTENGVCRDNRGSRPHDKIRVNYHLRHLKKLRFCINRKHVNAKGYFVWSLMDNFEWLDGYFVNFGLIRVDYDNKSLNRSCKDSASWFNAFLNKDGGSNQAEICKLFPSTEN